MKSKLSLAMLTALAASALASASYPTIAEPPASQRRRRLPPAVGAQSEELRQWNANVEAKRLEKLSRRAARRTA